MTSSNSSQQPTPRKNFEKLMADYQQVHQSLSKEVHHSSSINKNLPRNVWLGGSVGFVLVAALVTTWVFRLNIAQSTNKALGVSLLPKHALQAQIPPIKPIDTTRAINNQVAQKIVSTQNTPNTQTTSAHTTTQPLTKSSPTKTEQKTPVANPGLSKFESATPVTGMVALYQYLQQALQYPAQAREKQISGKVWVRFQVNTAGKIQNAKVMKGLGYGCDQEAIRIVTNMPLWHPATVNGKPVTTALKIPIAFNYQEAIKKEEKKKN